MRRKSRGLQSGYTILVVDDQDETLLSVRCLLEREGHRVLTAASGECALELFKANEVHLMLVDYFMPRMTGEQLVREIRAFDPYVQIILQTGYSGEKPPRTMLAELDIQGYHDKAEGPEQLLIWVDTALKAQRQIRDLCQRQRLQSELVANVSHEFRGPLTVISGYTEILLGDGFGAIDGDLKMALQAIGRTASGLNHLVSDFLNYAKLEAKTLDVARQPISLQELTDELTRLVDAQRGNRALRFEVERGAVDRVYTDPVKLRTILRNLVSNAIKFTAQGCVSLRIEADDEALLFRVADTGPGIAADAQELIFEPFRQLDGSTTRSYGGVGLGLALSRKLAQLLGGEILLHSQIGAGSTFTLVLPHVPPAEPVSPRAPARIAPRSLDVVAQAA
jgi:signal transduction histidine kinase